MKTKLKKYQRVGVKRMHRFNGRVLLADDMGLGKTLQALTYMVESDARLTIVVCPAGLKWNWEREAKKHVKRRATVLSGRTPPEDFAPDSRLLIINYDILKEWVPVLRKLRADLIILDECHKISDRGTQQSKLTRRLAKGAKHLICISGTPLTNRPAELFTALNLLHPNEFPSFFAYAERYCKPELKPWGWVYKGATNLKELHRNLRRLCMIRRLKSDVLPELAAKTRQVVLLDIERRSEYDKAFKDIVTWLARNVSLTAAKKAKKAEKLVRIGHLKRLVAELKLKGVIDWIESFLADTDRKLIVFATHKAVIGPLAKKFGRASVVIDGTVTGKARQAAVDTFNNNPQKRLLFANQRAAGVGWSCTSCSDVACIEFGWTPGEHTQAEDRCHGIGRGQEGVAVNVYYLVARDTIEEDISAIITRKQAVLDAVLDGKGETKDQTNIFTEVLEAIRRK